MSNIISVEKLNVNYRKTLVLQDLNFEISAGDYVGLSGPNGAGKTTLIKALLGLIKMSSGTIKIYGKPIGEFSDWSKIGYLPQRASSFNPLIPATVEEVVSHGLLGEKKFPKIISVADKNRIKESLSFLGINEIKDRLVSELSGGQQQRVFLARALVSNPEILILDEPSNSLDPQTREVFFDILKKLNKEKGTTIIITTHDLGYIGQHANKLLMIDKKIVFYGGLGNFCQSSEMGEFFGGHSQHIICHQH